MKLPSKVTSYSESVISKMPAILELLAVQDLTVLQIYTATKKQYSNTKDFLDTLDCLYALKKIEFSTDGEKLHYVG